MQCNHVVENFLPDRVSSLVLDLERQAFLSFLSTILRLGLDLGLWQAAEVRLVVVLHGAMAMRGQCVSLMTS